MRSANMGLILRHLRAHGGRTRARLAAETGLSRATMSSVIAELVDRGLVSEGEPLRKGRVGRPGVVVALEPGHVGAVGVEISVDYVVVRVIDLTGAIVSTKVVHAPLAEMPPSAVLDLVAAELGTALRQMGEQRLRPIAVTVSPPGVIDQTTGTVTFAPNLGWRNLPLLAGLQERLDCRVPIHLENDAKLSAVAEYVRWSGRGVEDLVFLTGGVGVGAGIIAGGHMVRGWKGFSGEVGHLPLDPLRRPCKCGRLGCWENVVGLRALFELCVPEGDALRDRSRPWSERLAELAVRAAEGDAATLDALATIGDSLGAGLSMITDVLNPQVVVLGGWFSFFGDTLLPRLAADLEQHRLQQVAPVQVAISEYGMYAAAHGGAMLALDDLFNDPTLAPLLGDDPSSGVLPQQLSGVGS